MPIAYICAMDWEADCLPDKANAFVAGIGAERAEFAAQKACDEGANLLISFGSAGGLAPNLASGDLVVSTNSIPAPTKALGSTANSAAKEEPDHLESVIAALSVLSPNSGSIYSSNSILNELQQKQAAYLSTNALAVDMESSAIHQVCVKNNCQFLAVRVVLDDAYSVMPQALVSACDDYGHVEIWKMAQTILCKPGIWPMLIPLGRAQSKVRQILKSAGCILENHFSGAVV